MQHIDKSVDVPVVFQRRKTVEAPGVHFLDRVVNVPVVLQRQVLSNPKVLESLGIPKDSSTDKVVAVPVVLKTHLPTTRMRMSVDVPHVKFIDKVVDVPPSKPCRKARSATCSTS